MKPPTTSCPKCGHHGWDGPRYQAGPPEHLAFVCIECRFPMKVPCLDEGPVARRLREKATRTENWATKTEPDHHAEFCTGSHHVYLPAADRCVCGMLKNPVILMGGPTAFMQDQ
jgi:hypothetical protein